MYIFCVQVKVAQSCPTLCDPMDCSPPDSSVRGILLPGKNTGVSCHFLLQGIFLTQVLNWVSCIASRCFTKQATREAPDSGMAD